MTNVSKDWLDYDYVQMCQQWYPCNFLLLCEMVCRVRAARRQPSSPRNRKGVQPSKEVGHDRLVPWLRSGQRSPTVICIFAFFPCYRISPLCFRGCKSSVACYRRLPMQADGHDGSSMCMVPNLIKALHARAQASSVQDGRGRRGSEAAK